MLLDARLARHEAAIRAWPEANDEPLKRGGTPGSHSGPGQVTTQV